MGKKQMAWWTSAYAVAVETLTPMNWVSPNRIAQWNPPTPAGAGTASPITLTGKLHGVTLNLMYGSSGPAETAAINQASKAWAAQSGNKVIVTNASNLTEQLDEAFAGGTPLIATTPGEGVTVNVLVADTPEPEVARATVRSQS